MYNTGVYPTVQRYCVQYSLGELVDVDHPHHSLGDVHAAGRLEAVVTDRVRPRFQQAHQLLLLRAPRPNESKQGCENKTKRNQHEPNQTEPKRKGRDVCVTQTKWPIHKKKQCIRCAHYTRQVRVAHARRSPVCVCACVSQRLTLPAWQKNTLHTKVRLLYDGVPTTRGLGLGLHTPSLTAGVCSSASTANVVSTSWCLFHNQPVSQTKRLYRLEIIPSALSCQPTHSTLPSCRRSLKQQTARQPTQNALPMCTARMVQAAPSSSLIGGFSLKGVARPKRVASLRL